MRIWSMNSTTGGMNRPRSAGGARGAGVNPAHPVNANFDHRGRVLVDKVNNVRIESSRTLSGF